MKVVASYMEEHHFLEADKKKVQDFLRQAGAVDAYLTRETLYYTERSGMRGEISRAQLGIQDNFV